MKLLTKKIGIELLLYFVIALVLGIFATGLGFLMVSNLYIMPRVDRLTTMDFIVTSIMVFLFGIFVFVAVFLILASMKIRYIRYISAEVKEIARDDLGRTLNIKGNDELAELCESINLLSLKLKQQFENERREEQLKNELITNISHDLRTPLTGLIGYLGILKDQKEHSPEDQETYIVSSYRLSIKLKSLIDELFEYTKLSDSKVRMDFEEADLSSILLQMTGEYVPLFENKGLVLRVKIEDFHAVVDVEKIVRVFDNLLSNALKYSCEGTTVHVHGVKRDDHCLLTVSNQSPLIEAEQLIHLFDKFYRLDSSRSGQTEGSGLGLAIAKRIIELHRGMIWAECEGQTLSIKFTIPVQIS